MDIDGLEYFKNLESLDLSFHAITDITPLAGLIIGPARAVTVRKKRQKANQVFLSA